MPSRLSSTKRRLDKQLYGTPSPGNQPPITAATSATESRAGIAPNLTPVDGHSPRPVSQGHGVPCSRTPIHHGQTRPRTPNSPMPRALARRAIVGEPKRTSTSQSLARQGAATRLRGASRQLRALRTAHISIRRQRFCCPNEIGTCDRVAICVLSPHPYCSARLTRTSLEINRPWDERPGPHTAARTTLTDPADPSSGERPRTSQDRRSGRISGRT